MRWSTTPDVAEFAARTRSFLAADPVAHTMLLTEVDFLLRHPQPGPQTYAWCDDDGEVVGAVVEAPGHPPVLSTMPPDAVAARLSMLDADPLGAPAGLAPALAGRGFSALRRFTIWSCAPAPGPDVAGCRIATSADLPLLLEWFDAFKAAHPHDPSDRPFVIDDPLADGGIVLAGADGVPVAMASRSPVVAHMTRLGLRWQPDGGTDAADRALEHLLARATGGATHVVVLTGATDPESERWASRGFDPVGDRVLLSRAT